MTQSPGTRQSAYRRPRAWALVLAGLLGALVALGAGQAQAAVAPTDDPETSNMGRWSARDDAHIIATVVSAFQKNKRLQQFAKVLIWNFADFTGDPMDQDRLRTSVREALTTARPSQKFMLKGYATLQVDGRVECDVRRIDGRVLKTYTIWLKAMTTGKPSRQIWSSHTKMSRTVLLPESAIGSP
jgi:hypothetical protein